MTTIRTAITMMMSRLMTCISMMVMITMGGGMTTTMTMIPIHTVLATNEEDDYYNNTPKVIFDMHGNPFTIDDNDNMVPYDEKPMTLQDAQRQINAILAGCTTASSIKAFATQAKHKHDEFFLPKTAACTVPVTLYYSTPTYAKNDDHDAFLYHRRNKVNTISPRTTKSIPAATNGKTTASAPIEIPVKDDPSITPTLETLSTLDTRSLHPTNIDTDAILSITIWNQPIVQYQMPIQSTIRHQSRRPSTAV